MSGSCVTTCQYKPLAQRKGGCYGQLNTLESGHYEQVSQTVSQLKATMMVIHINSMG